MGTLNNYYYYINNDDDDKAISGHLEMTNVSCFQEMSDKYFTGC